MKKEKYINTGIYSEVKIVENEIVSFNKNDTTTTSFRVYKDGFVGVHYQRGKLSDKEGFEKAERIWNSNAPTLLNWKAECAPWIRPKNF